MFKQLRNKFMLLNMSIISVVMVVAFAVIYLITYNRIYDDNLAKLDSVAADPRGVATEMPKVPASPESSANNAEDDFYVANNFTLLLHSSGQLLGIIGYISMSWQDYRDAAAAAWENAGTINVLNLGDKKWLYKVILIPSQMQGLFFNPKTLSMEIIDNTRYQVTFLDITDSSRVLSQLLMTFFLIGLGMLLVIFGISYYFANRAIRPISNAWDKQKQFVADASHELRTPLAIIDANSDALLASREDEPEEQEKWIGYIREQTGRMNKLVGDMLYLAKSEDMEINAESIPVDFSSIAADAILSMEAVAYEKGIQLNHVIDPDIIIKGDGEQLKRVVMILMDNAFKYTDEKGYIEVRLYKQRQVVFSVRNSGQGIPAKDIPYLFDRFYRADASRARATGGYGLGLSIAQSIVNKLGGKIMVESIENQHTTFTLYI